MVPTILIYRQPDRHCYIVIKSENPTLVNVGWNPDGITGLDGAVIPQPLSQETNALITWPLLLLEPVSYRLASNRDNE